MALPVSGGIYTFQCLGAEDMFLNLYYYNGISNGQNVILWDGDGSKEQQWKFDGKKLLTVRDTNFALDKYTVAGNPNNNNADVWEANDPTNQNIVFESTSSGSNVVRIKLASSNMYLTAYGFQHGTNDGKTPTSKGNVFWASKTTSTMQQWIFSEVSGSNEFYWPTESHTLSQGGGYGNGHLGIDIRATTPGVAGDKVYAFADGIVAKITTPPLNDGYGVRLHHINPYPELTGGKKQLRTQYLHFCQEPIVRKNEYVRAGQVIGYMGDSGNADGVHLHFETRVSDTEFPMDEDVYSDYNQGTVVDPMIFVGDLQ